jgi:hypothetical protein
METLRRIIFIILFPKAEWEVIATEASSVDLLLLRIILPLSLLAPVATVIGMNVFDREWDATQGYLVPHDQIFAAGATTFFASIASIFLLAAIFVAIAPMYGSSRSYTSALKVAANGAIPVLVAGITLIIPVMVIIGMVAVCHSLYLYWLGVRRVLAVETGAQTEFVGISLVLLSAVSVVFGAFLSSIGFV